MTTLYTFKQPASHLLLVKTPNNGYAGNTGTPTKAKVHLRITDAVGREIFNTAISFQERKYNINTSAYGSGLYFVTLYSDSSKLFGGKLSILK